ncbi:hypothetical protein [Rhizobium mesoamericanum]|uniref:hypothetical protein n=1 Tax=Rhizobium mesoamericanum TaxID=1079800 RepID=UPI001FCA9FB7|nr:hypothetical protein [Rhizobium mesoamericanum]
MDRVGISFLSWVNDHGRHQLAEGACRANINGAGLCCDDIGKLLDVLSEALNSLRVKLDNV